MPLSTKIIRRRIRSIRSTKKITKAMEMVAAAKMRKAVSSVIMSRAYSHAAWQAIVNLATRVSEKHHPLLERRRKVKKICVIVISSNRGLCGGFNSHIFAKALQYVDTRQKIMNVAIDWISIGKKSGEFLARSKRNIIASFLKSEVVSGVEDILPISKIAIEAYINRTYDEVDVVYTDFVSAMTQRPRVKKLLPFDAVEDTELGYISTEKRDDSRFQEEYEFETSPDFVMDIFLRKLIDVQLYQALLESTASEHSARMLAMRQATDAAEDMINELTLVFNQARQAAITKEIAEISGGKAALENS